MGGIGSDLAVKSADIILLNDNIQSIVRCHQNIAKKTKTIVYQNIAFIMIVKIGFLVPWCRSNHWYERGYFCQMLV